MPVLYACIISAVLLRDRPLFNSNPVTFTALNIRQASIYCDGPTPRWPSVQALQPWCPEKATFPTSVCACSIVFANKFVFKVLKFQFVYMLTLLHVLTTVMGMRLFAYLGFYKPKRLPLWPMLAISAAFVGYIVGWNLALEVTLLSALQCASSEPRTLHSL